MRYFLDTEFNGFGGELLSLALVREDGAALYLVHPESQMDANPDPWVLKNVILALYKVPKTVKVNQPLRDEWPGYIREFLQGDERPYIVTDWPDDISYFCKSTITGPGLMAPIPSLRFEMVRVDAYPTEVKGAIQHNAYWDAMALRHLLLPII